MGSGDRRERGSSEAVLGVLGVTDVPDPDRAGERVGGGAAGAGGAAAGGTGPDRCAAGRSGVLRSAPGRPSTPMETYPPDPRMPSRSEPESPPHGDAFG